MRTNSLVVVALFLLGAASLCNSIAIVLMAVT